MIIDNNWKLHIRKNVMSYCRKNSQNFFHPSAGKSIFREQNSAGMLSFSHERRKTTLQNLYNIFKNTLI